MRQVHFDVFSRRTKVLSGRIGLSLRSADDFKLQRLARRQIDHRFIGRFAAFANLIEMKPLARARLGHFVIDFELMSFRRQQFITGVRVGRDVLGGGHGTQRCNEQNAD